jgi:hypothetical protein
LGKSLGAFFTDPDRSLGRLARVSHDERMNLKTADEMNHGIGFQTRHEADASMSMINHCLTFCRKQITSL